MPITVAALAQDVPVPVTPRIRTGRTERHRRIELGPVNFESYQEAAARTGGEITVDHPIVYPTFGLANEAGEVAGKVKKIFRDKGGVITDADRDALALLRDARHEHLAPPIVRTVMAVCFCARATAS
jgi:hypothetical protein